MPDSLALSRSLALLVFPWSQDLRDLHKSSLLALHSLVQDPRGPTQLLLSGRFAGCRLLSDVGCRCAASSDAGYHRITASITGPVLVGQNLYKWLGHLHSKFKLP